MTFMYDSFLSTYLLVIATLFPVMEPISMSFLFTSVTPGIRNDVRAALCARIALYAAIVIVCSMYLGTIVLSIYGISVGVLRLAGGAVLVMAGWNSLNAKPKQTQSDNLVPQTVEEAKKMAFYPYTLPLTTGPGAISSMAAVGTTMHFSVPGVVGALAATATMCVAIYFAFRFNEKLNRAFGAAASEALAKLCAFILICIGTQVFWNGLTELMGKMPGMV